MALVLGFIVQVHVLDYTENFPIGFLPQPFCRRHFSTAYTNKRLDQSILQLQNIIDFVPVHEMLTVLYASVRQNKKSEQAHLECE